ncbi:MAG: sugar phosphate isomerase/epimerase [Chloroflexi bacterium]|nr:sugar phosphate isomerase/epimerase [Chloroflexota bacterium]
MRLAYLTPLTRDTIKQAQRLGYDAVEVGAGWVDNPALDELLAHVDTVREVLQEHGISVTSVAIYGGTINTPHEQALAHWEKAMTLAQALGCQVVSGLTGRDNNLSVQDNIPLFQERFAPICALAEERFMRLALEPWPGNVLGHGPYRWTNLATTPELWDMLFEAVPSPALGLEYDPSHLYWQGIDYLQVIRDYGGRIYHLHAKDILVHEARLKRVGVHGRGWWRFVLPGLGQLDWPAIFQTLRAVGYAGDVAVEHEDREYLKERWNEGLALALKMMRPFVAEYDL